MQNYPYFVDIPKKRNEWVNRIEWLLNQRNNGMDWKAKKDRYWFKQESDLILYMLRWA